MMLCWRRLVEVLPAGSSHADVSAVTRTGT
jgi:hypothetical protein